MTDLLKDKKVLVLDDEQGMLNIVKELLNKHGAHAYCATTADDALRMADLGSHDLIIFDRCLPKSDGNDVLKKLKTKSHTKHTPVIMLTGLGRINEIKSSISLGADGYVVKPFTPKNFESQIEKVLSRAE